jgi:hypothetical protein
VRASHQHIISLTIILRQSNDVAQKYTSAALATSLALVATLSSRVAATCLGCCDIFGIAAFMAVARRQWQNSQ